MKTPPIPIIRPCSADWQAMSGDDRQRLCAQCQKHVHNLSAMTHAEVHKFVAERDGTECIGYEYDERGQVVLAARWSWFWQATRRFRSGLRWGLAAILPAVFGGCASPQVGGSSCQTVGRRAVLPGTPMPLIERKANRGADGTMILGEIPPPPPPSGSRPKPASGRR